MTHMVQNAVYRNWNWSGIAFIGIGIGIELPFGLGTGFGIGVELPLSELELELNCKNGIDPSSEVYIIMAYQMTQLLNKTIFCIILLWPDNVSQKKNEKSMSIKGFKVQ